MCLFLEPPIFGEAKSTDSRTMGFWTDGHTDARTHGRTHGQILKNAFFKIPFYERNPKKTG